MKEAAVPRLQLLRFNSVSAQSINHVTSSSIVRRFFDDDDVDVDVD